jgi:ribose transport system substrate-binding protein
VVVLGILICASVFAGGTKEGASAKSMAAKPRISVVVMANNSEYWNTVRVGAEQAGKALGADIVFLGPAAESDVIGEVNMVEDQISSGTSALVVAASDKSAFIPSFDKAKAKNIPVVLIDTVVSWNGKVSQMGTDNIAAGYAAGKYLASKLQAGDKVAILRGIMSSPTHDDRANGGVKALKEAGIDVVAILPADSLRSKGVSVTEDLIQSHPDLKGMYATNDEMALGAVQALQAAGKKIPVVGFDAILDATLSILNGGEAATIAQNPVLEGYVGVQAAVAALKGQTVKKVYDTGVQVITQENAKAFMSGMNANLTVGIDPSKYPPIQ